MNPKKKIVPLVGLVVLAGLGAIGFLKRDSISYKIYKKTYEQQIKKENITPFN